MSTNIGINTAIVNGFFTVRRSCSERLVYRPMELRDILARIERRLEAVGMSASAASKAAGKPDAIRNLQRAIERDERQGVSTATLNALAPVLKTSAIWLFAGAGPEEIGTGPNADVPFDQSSHPEIKPSNLKTVRVPIVGVAEAGAFREAPEYEPDEFEYLSEPPDREYPYARLIGFDIAGDSLNDLKPRPLLPGDRAIALDFSDVEGMFVLRNDLLVVVEQTRDGGHTREWSVKQLEIYEDRYEFCPRSTNKRHKPIVVPKKVFHDPSEEDGRHVRILGIVRRASTVFNF